MLLVYCEHGAQSKGLQKLAQDRLVKLVHFPHDPDSRSRSLTLTPPAVPRWSDLNVSWSDFAEMGITWAEVEEKGLFEDILKIIGHDNLRDAQLLEAASRAGCWGFVTADSDILQHRDQLEDVLGLRILSQTEAVAAIEERLRHGAG